MEVENTSFQFPSESESLDKQCQLKFLTYDFRKHIDPLISAIKNLLIQDFLVFLTGLVLNFSHSYYVGGPQNHPQV